MIRSLSRWIVASSLAGLAACASASGGSAPGHVTPPQPLSHGTPPELRVPITPSSERAPVRVSIEVLVDETGRPDMSTFKVTGFGAGENEEALRKWVEQTTFRPAQRDGVAVPALYHARLEASARRM